MSSYFTNFLIIPVVNYKLKCGCPWLNRVVFNTLTFVTSNYTHALVFTMVLFTILTMTVKTSMRNEPAVYVMNKITSYWSVVHPHSQVTGSRATAQWLFLSGLFVFILLVNLLGIVWGTFPVSSQFGFAIGMSLTCWLVIMGNSVYNHGWSSGAFVNYMPTGAPMSLAYPLVMIETVSQLVRPLSLGLRLAANMTAGHLIMSIVHHYTYAMIMKIFTMPVKYYLVGHRYYCINPGNMWCTLGMIVPTGFSGALLVLELGICCLQAYVFTLLVSIYLRESTEIH